MGLLRQHFNYGSGGTLLIVHKRVSKLPRGFTNYQFTSNSALSFVLMLMVSGLYLRHLPTFLFGFGFLSFGFLILIVLYAEVAWRNGLLRKMVFYPLFDIARWVFFTFRGTSCEAGVGPRTFKAS